MSSIIDICNVALIALGADLIADLGEDSEPARVCSALYPDARDEVLAMHPWNAALARRELEAASEPPLMEWAYQYPLPEDPWCLRALRLERRSIPFRVEGRMLLCDEGPAVKLLYIARIADPAAYSPGLARAVAHHLAHLIAFRLTNSRTTEEAMRLKFAQHMREARSIDGQEGSADDLEIESDFLAARL